MSNGGEVKSRISLDNKGFLKSVKEVTSSLNGVKSTAGKVLNGIGSASKIVANGVGKVINGIGSAVNTAFEVVEGAVVGATGAFVGLVTASVKATGDIEQSFGGIEALFGNEQDLINQVKATGQKAYQDMQMSANDYYNSFLEGYSLINASLNNEQKSIKQTNRLLQLEADLMNTYGGTTEKYATAINWALKGTYSYVDNLNLGITGTKDGFLEAAKNCGYLVDSVDELTAEQKIDIIEQYAKKVGAFGRSAKEASGTIQGSIKSLGASWNNFLSGAGDFSAVVDSASVAMTNIIKAVKEAIPHIVNGISENLPALLNLVIDIVKEVSSVILSNLPLIVDTVLKVFETVLKSFESNIDQIDKFVDRVIFGIARAITNSLPILLDTISRVAPVIIENLGYYISNLQEPVYNAIVSIVKTIINIAPDLLSIIDSLIWEVSFYLKGGAYKEIKDAILNILNGVCTIILDNIPELFDTILELVMIVGKAIIDNLPMIIDVVINSLTKIVNTLADNSYVILDAILKLLIEIIQVLINNLPMVADATLRIVMALAQALADNSYMIGKATGELIAKMIEVLWSPEFLKGIIEAAWNIGKAIVVGIATHLNTLYSTVWNNLKAQLSKLVSSVRKFLGIESPSKVFAEIGKNMALGMGEGFNNEIQGVFDDMKPELNVGIDKVNNAVQGAGVVGATRTQNNTFNINNGLDMGVAMQELNWLYRRM